jgi:general secretion pathway protein C
MKEFDPGFYGRLSTIALSAYFLADVTALLVGRFIPEPPVARMGGYNRFSGGPRTKLIEDYNVIFARNLFNSRGIIPGDETQGGPQDLGGPPIKSTLPFNLIGTLILNDELKSIATIEDKSATMVYPVRVDDEIPQKARIVKIEARKVIFVNSATGRREYIELPDEGGMPTRVSFSNTRISAPSQGIEKVSATQFNINGAEVDKTLSDLNNVLTQARAVPNFENGQPAGYKLFQIVPGSIYDKLGLQNGDVIAGLNDQAINDPGKAFEMLSELKTSSHLELQIKRDGRVSNFAYNIQR